MSILGLRYTQKIGTMKFFILGIESLIASDVHEPGITSSILI